MSVWTTKASGMSRDYIVMQHTLKGVNYVINGVKFRDSYAVVERGSKTYSMLKKVPVLRAAKEYPLLYLEKLTFITRTSDVKAVYGQEVYSHFLIEKDKRKNEQEILEQAQILEAQRKFLENREADLQNLEKIVAEMEAAKAQGDDKLLEELQQQKPVLDLCRHRHSNGQLCKETAADYSPGNFCHTHLFEDPKLIEFGLEKTKFMTKDETKRLYEKAKNVLEKAKKQGKF